MSRPPATTECWVRGLWSIYDEISLVPRYISVSLRRATVGSGTPWPETFLERFKPFDGSRRSQAFLLNALPSTRKSKHDYYRRDKAGPDPKSETADGGRDS